MKDKTFDARNNEMRARTKRARSAPTTAPGPGSIEALADAPAPKPTKKKVAAIAPDKVAPDFNPLAGAGAASTDLMKAAGKKSRAPRATTTPAKVDWLDTGLESTGKLTVDGLARAWIARLDAGGKTTASTMASYANDLKTAITFFGADAPVKGINAAYIDVFNLSDGVMKLRSGAPKAQPTILKMRRAFRMAVEWAKENEVNAHMDQH